MPASVSLDRMVDLALGTPEVGAVNFNVLHTLLHAILNKLDICNVKADINEDDESFLKVRSGDRASVISAGKDSGIDTDAESVLSKEDSIPKKRSHYHGLEAKVAWIETQIDVLNKLPSNEDLFDKTKSTTGAAPMKDMWQTMQLKKRVDANEAGVGKLMSMIEDLLREMQELRNTNADLRKRIEELSDTTDMLNRIKDLESKLTELRNDMDKQFNDLRSDMDNRFGQFPSPDEFANFVTWKALEDALRGIKDDLQPPERVVIEMSMQTDPVRPPSAKPSKELQEMLARLGVLTGRHDKLEVRVDVIEDELKNKANKDDVKEFDIPTDLLDQLEKMKADLEALLKARERDNLARQKDLDALNRAHRAISQLQAEIDKLISTTKFLSDENENKTKQIDSLTETTKDLEERKADKEYVDVNLENKADKKYVDAKLDTSVFDKTVEDINKMIADILEKLDGHDEEWKKALAELSKEIDNKIDRLELDALKDYLESRLRALAKQIKAAHGPGDFNEDDAAGIRKQLMQRFHCISCDRPVDMMPNGPIPSLPNQNGLPGTRSSRPYTTFELEQIRQQAKLFGGPEVTDQLYSTARPCGGSHTMTYPHKRITRLTHLSNLFRDEEPFAAFTKEELDVMGADGHIYKGRLGTTLPGLTENRVTFPAVPSAQTTNRPASPTRSKTTIGATRRSMPPARSQSPGRNRPSSAISPSGSRPHSAHPHPRPLSARAGDGQGIANLTSASQQESGPPPPPASEAAPEDIAIETA